MWYSSVLPAISNQSISATRRCMHISKWAYYWFYIQWFVDVKIPRSYLSQFYSTKEICRISDIVSRYKSSTLINTSPFVSAWFPPPIRWVTCKYPTSSSIKFSAFTFTLAKGSQYCRQLFDSLLNASISQWDLKVYLRSKGLSNTLSIFLRIIYLSKYVERNPYFSCI